MSASSERSELYPSPTPYKNFDLSFYSTSIGYIRFNISVYIHIGISIARTREGVFLGFSWGYYKNIITCIYANYDKTN